jgi:heme-degrading monooxygenase HmoA
MVPTIFTLPWRWARRPQAERALLFASRFDAVGVKDRWRLLVGGMRLRRYAIQSPGALGVGLRAHLVAGRFYTVSMWSDEASLLAFARSEEHRTAIRSITELGPVHGVLISREVQSGRPRWRETLKWVSGAEPGPYHRERV